MRMPVPLELARGLLVTFAASGAGAMLGALIFTGEPAGGLSLLPFTLFGSLAVLLPVYLWCRDVRQASTRTAYLAVFVSGLVGGYLILLFFFVALGGSVANPGGFPLIGSLFGGVTGACWIAVHWLSAGWGRGG